MPEITLLITAYKAMIQREAVHAVNAVEAAVIAETHFNRAEFLYAKRIRRRVEASVGAVYRSRYG